MDLDRVLLEMSRVELQVEVYFAADCAPPRDYQGPQLVAVVHAGRLATLTAGGREVRDFGREATVALLSELAQARGELVREGMDTACGRMTTSLRLSIYSPRGGESSFTLHGTVNHILPYPLPPRWSAALHMLRDALGPLGGATAEAWDLAMAWTAPVDLGPAFQAGAPVRVPHQVAAIVHGHGEALYLRTGQPPGRSRLYRLAGEVLTDLDEGRVIAPSAEGRWALPCGGGAVTVRRGWDTPPGVLLRSDDDRGLYVQRA